MDRKSNLKSKLITVPVNIMAIIVAFMILLRFAYLLYDFMRNPFHEPATLTAGSEAVKHVMSGLILLELFALTLRFLVQEIIDPNLIIIAVLTALGRDLVVLNIAEMDYTKLIGIGFILAVTIVGLYVLKKCGFQCLVETTRDFRAGEENKDRKRG
jgi:uncharacterized membrane protein (DUF373 family)